MGGWDDQAVWELHPYLPCPILEIDNQQGDYAFMENSRSVKLKPIKPRNGKIVFFVWMNKLLKKNSSWVAEVIDTPLRGTVVKSDSLGDLPTLWTKGELEWSLVDPSWAQLRQMTTERIIDWSYLGDYDPMLL